MSAPSIFQFNEAYYLAQNPDVQAAVRAGAFHSGLKHFEMYGRFEGRASTPFFDANVYRNENPDLAQAGITTDAQLRVHFNNYGFAEGRIFLGARFFDYEYYAEKNPDLADVGIDTKIFLQRHFIQYGIYEGRSASPLIGGASYVDQNPDLSSLWQASGGKVSGFTSKEAFGIFHYYNYGLVEGRASVPAEIVKVQLNAEILVGSDASINSQESSTATEITVLVTSGEVQAIAVLGKQNGIDKGVSATLNTFVNSYQSSYKFNASQFDDGPLIVQVADKNGEIKEFSVLKDTVFPTFKTLDYDDIKITFTSSESAEAGVYYKLPAPLDYAEYPVLSTYEELREFTVLKPGVILVHSQESVKTTYLKLIDAVGNRTIGIQSIILGTDKSERIEGVSTNSNIIYGFEGDDTMYGGTLSDTIFGHGGNDVIIGGAGDDVIDVGSGSDTVVLGTVNVGGIDTVSNFGSNDFIKFAGGLDYWDDTILGDMKTKGSLIDAAQYVMGSFDGWALGFIYNGESYVVVDGALGNNQFNPATDAIVKLTGVNLSILSSQNFIG